MDEYLIKSLLKGKFKQLALSTNWNNKFVIVIFDI